MTKYFYFYMNCGHLPSYTELKFSIWSAHVMRKIHPDIKVYLHILKWPHQSSKIEQETFIPLVDYLWHFINVDTLRQFDKSPYYMNRYAYFGLLAKDKQYGADPSPGDPAISLHCDTLLRNKIEINDKNIMFYSKGDKWYDISWGFLTEPDAKEFVDYLKGKGISTKQHSEYACYDTSVFYVPSALAQDWREKYTIAFEWLAQKYPYEWFLYSTFDKIVLSILAQESGLTIDTVDGKDSVVHLKNVLPYPALTSYVFQPV